MDEILYPKSGIVQPKCQIVTQVSTSCIHPVLFDGDQLIEICYDTAERIFERNFVAAGWHLPLKFYRISQIRHYGQWTGGHLLRGDKAHFLVFGWFGEIILDIFSLPLFAMVPLFPQKTKRKEPHLRHWNICSIPFKIVTHRLLSISRSASSDGRGDRNESMSSKWKKSFAKYWTMLDVEDLYHSALAPCRMKW